MKRFEDGCTEAMQQIKDRRYGEALIKDGMNTIYQCAIACYRKQCRVVTESMKK